MALVRFLPSGKEKDVKPGSTILSAANRSSLPIGQSCNGDGVCGWCRVQVLEGADHLMAPGPREQRLIEEMKFERNERAACLAKVLGDCVITTTYW